MSERRLLVRCAAARPEQREEIERWLTRRVDALSTEGALLYRLAPGQADASDHEREAAWVVEFGSPEAPAAPGAVSALLGELRMLGLEPAVFRASSGVSRPMAQPARA